MFYYLSEWSHYFTFLNVFQYVTFRAMGAAATSMFLSLWIGPSVIQILTRLKLGQPIRGKEEVHKLADLHGAKTGTPTMGGLMILICLTSSSLLWAKPNNAYLLVALGATLLLGLIGFLDDYKKIRQKKSSGISSRQKLFFQIIIAFGVAVFFLIYPGTFQHVQKLYVPFFKDPLIQSMGWVTLFFLMLVVVGSSNAVNLTDGLDGLAIGCTVSVSAVYAIFTYVSSNFKLAEYLLIPFVPGAEELTVFCAALVGASLGFLWFNCHPAKVFMGDTGSLAIGGALAVVAIAVNQEFLLVIVGGIFVIEAISVILQVIFFKMTGKRIFAMSPIHHHFELRGWNETTVVVRFWILSVVFALIGLASLKLR
jgi:phospho-N-acetylmuramoyl-pentapeptide-transferase